MNVGEAVNFGVPGWLPFALQSHVRNRVHDDMDRGRFELVNVERIVVKEALECKGIWEGTETPRVLDDAAILADCAVRWLSEHDIELSR